MRILASCNNAYGDANNGNIIAPSIAGILSNIGLFLSLIANQTSAAAERIKSANDAKVNIDRALGGNTLVNSP